MILPSRWLLALVWIGVVSSSYLCADDAVMSHLQREAPAGWARITKQQEGLEFVVRLTEESPRAAPSPSRQIRFDLHWNRRPGAIVLERSYDENGSQNRSVIVANELYGFEVRPSGAGSWELVTFYPNPPRDTDRPELPLAPLRHQAYLNPLTTVENIKGLSLLQRVDDPDFRMETATQAGPHVRVHFRVIARPPKGPPVPGTADVLFDPDANWAVKEYRLAADGDKTNVVWTAEMADYSVDGYTPPKTITCSYYDSSTAKTWRTRRVAEYLSVKRSTAKPEAFRLSGYGLPEPAGAQEPRKPLWPTLLSAAAVCAAVAALIWWFGKKKAAGNA